MGQNYSFIPPSLVNYILNTNDFVSFLDTYSGSKKENKGRKIYVTIYVAVIRRVLLFPLLILPCLSANISNFSQFEISCKHTRRVLCGRSLVFIQSSLFAF